MIINHNIAALNTHRQMGSAQSAQMDSMEKLSSGMRINSAKDDAAGLTISEKMRGQIRGLEQGSRNAQDGISLIQTAEGALSETQDILQRMRDLAVQSANDTNTDVDRGEIQKEFNQLAKETTRIAKATEFNTHKLLDGSDADGKVFQVGANATQNLTLVIGNMDATALLVGTGTTEADTTGINISTQAAADISVYDYDYHDYGRVPDVCRGHWTRLNLMNLSFRYGYGCGSFWNCGCWICCAYCGLQGPS